MDDYSLVPVDYQPEFENGSDVDRVSLVPVDHNPFAEEGGGVQTAQAQPPSPPQAPGVAPPVPPVVPNERPMPAPKGDGGPEQIVHLSASDILSSYAKGAANSVTHGAANLLYDIGQAVSLGELGKRTGGPPHVRPFTPISKYFATEGDTTARGVSAVAGGAGLGRTLAGRAEREAAGVLSEERRGGGPPASSFSGSARSPLQAPEGPPRNSPGEFNGRPFSGHALDQLQNRGFPPSVVDKIIENGVPNPGRTPGTTRFYDSNTNISVVRDDATGNIVTIRHGN